MKTPLKLLLVFALSACDCGSDPGTEDGSIGDGGGDDVVNLPDGVIVLDDGALVLPDGAPYDAGEVADGGAPTDGGGTDGAPADVTGDANLPCVPSSCSGRVTECTDCIDNDGDGLLDSADPECLGPCDNTEGPVLLAGVGGEAGGPCKSDCYFDFGNGSGNDQCEWDHRCDPLSVAPNFDPEGEACEYDAARVGGMTCPDAQSDTCLDVCAPLTPNGCDCFGCCTFDALEGRSAADGGEWVWIGSRDDDTDDGSCTIDDVTDRTACRPCTPVPGCLNECGPCELCIGRSELPPECFPTPPPDAGVPDGGPPYDGGVPPARCDPGVQPCGLTGDEPCGVDYYCVTGCCQSILI